ncbi:GNAT family N-acetyltransferase [Tahibacter sp. UC22_41]|uniref:GNAT family N-acetyltransferase n=1 Tax=Tahibacter sp. UC22_41 TaxID=3350178 RepID=UPI0036D9FF1F
MNASARRADAVAGLQTERLDLRPLTLADAADYWPLVHDADILRHVGEAPCTSLDAVRELLCNKPLADYANHGYGRLAVITRDDGRFVGWCGLKYLPELDEVNIGYRFLRDCWGRGYASEAGAAVLQQGFTQLGCGASSGWSCRTILHRCACCRSSACVTSAACACRCTTTRSISMRSLRRFTDCPLRRRLPVFDCAGRAIR